MLKEGLLKENIDGEAIFWAYNRIRKRKHCEFQETSAEPLQKWHSESHMYWRGLLISLEKHDDQRRCVESWKERINLGNQKWQVTKCALSR